MLGLGVQCFFFTDFNYWIDDSGGGCSSIPATRSGTCDNLINPARPEQTKHLRTFDNKNIIWKMNNMDTTYG